MLQKDIICDCLHELSDCAKQIEKTIDTTGFDIGLPVPKTVQLCIDLALQFHIEKINQIRWELRQNNRRKRMQPDSDDILL
jgi:D-ribose pyranose/furanose isomerase RbsD